MLAVCVVSNVELIKTGTEVPDSEARILNDQDIIKEKTKETN